MFIQVLLTVAISKAAAAGQFQRDAAWHTLNISIDRVVAHTSSAVLFSHGVLKLSEGPHLILLRNLSAPADGNQSLEEKSLQVNLEGGGALVERIVWDDVPLATKEELKAIEDEIQAVNSNNTRVKEKIQLSESHMSTLHNFANNLVSPSPELVNKGDSIVQILREVHSAQLDAGESAHSLKAQSRELNYKLQHLQMLLARSSQPQRVAKVYISVERESTVMFHLQHIIASVQWRPHYEIHVNSTTGGVTMMYHALVHQQTGHPWANVSMELCTGAPSSDRRLPSLAPWFITSTSNIENFGQNRAKHSKSKRPMYVEQSSKNSYSARMARPMATFAKEDSDTEFDEETSESSRTSSLQSEVISSGASDVFILPKRQTIPPAHDIRVNIATISLKANLTYTAVPKKSTKIYVQALITNKSPFTLLPGTSLVFVDGSFVGSSNVNLIPINGQAFVDVGIDNALSVVKKGVLAETKSTGGVWISRTKTTEFQYNLVLKSMRSSGVTVRVQDQVPLPQSEGLKVVVVTPKIGEVRANHQPEQIDENITLRAGGEIVWECFLPPDTTHSIPLQYTVEVDADHRIHNFDVGNFDL